MTAQQSPQESPFELGLYLCREGQWSKYKDFVLSHPNARTIPWMVAKAALSANDAQIAQDNLDFAMSAGLWDPEAMRSLASDLVSKGLFDAASELTTRAETAEAARTETTTPEPSQAAELPNAILRKLSHQLENLSTQLSRLHQLHHAQATRDKKSLKLVFLMQSPIYWNTWSQLYALCTKDPRFDTIVVLADRLQGSRTQYECSAREFLLERNIDFVDVDYYNLEQACPDIVLYQSPYSQVIHPKFALPRIQAMGIRAVYTPYCVDMCGGRFLEHTNFQGEMVTQAWRVYARSERQKREFARLCPSGSAHVSVMGAPKLDALQNYEPGKQAQRIQEFAAGRKILLYNAHFRVDAHNRGFSTFPVWEPRLRTLLTQRDDIVLLFRPHPNLFGHLREKGLLPEDQVDALIQFYEDSDNIYLDQSFDYRDAMCSADLLLSDASSLLLEFASLRKPVIYFRNDLGPGLNHDRDLAETFYQPEDLDALNRELDQLLTGVDRLQEARDKALNEVLYTPEKGTSHAIMEDLASLLSNELARHPTKLTRK